MPVYDFKCLNKKCGEYYEARATFADVDAGKYPSVKCPKCGSKKKDKVLIGAPAFAGSSDLKNNDHDYRFKSNLPKVAQERINAQKAAKEKTGFTSAKPYNDINDLNKNNFGEVK